MKATVRNMATGADTLDVQRAGCELLLRMLPSVGKEFLVSVNAHRTVSKALQSFRTSVAVTTPAKRLFCACGECDVADTG